MVPTSDGYCESLGNPCKSLSSVISFGEGRLEIDTQVGVTYFREKKKLGTWAHLFLLISKFPEDTACAWGILCPWCPASCE